MVLFCFFFQINLVKAWLATEENKAFVPHEDLELLLTELDNNTIAIKASNVFPVTFHTVAHVRF